MNPMIRKELRQRMRERRAWLLPSLYLLALGAAVALAYYFQTEDIFGFEQREIQGAEIGVVVFTTVIFTQMALLLLLAPVFSAGSVTIEKEQRTLAGLLTSLLTPFDIWWGKYAAALMFLVLLLVCSLPVLSLSFALGGVGPWEVAKAAGVTVLVMASVSAIGLYCSSFFRRSVHSTAVCYAVVIALTVLTFVAYTIMTSRWMAAHPAGQTGQDIPRYIIVPLYLNPFFPLGAVLGEHQAQAHQHQYFPHWAASLISFAVLGSLAALLGLRNIRRCGEQL